jgi:transcriptional regulator with XRE-family HTH domain
MKELIQFLTEQVNTSSLRDVETKTGISYAAIQRIIKGNFKNKPEIETLEKLAQAYQLPLWRVMEMAGVALEWPDDAHTLTRRFASLIQADSTFRQLVELLVRAGFDTRTEISAYLHVRRRTTAPYEDVHMLWRFLRDLPDQLQTAAAALGISRTSLHTYRGQRVIDESGSTSDVFVLVNGDPLRVVAPWVGDVEWGYTGTGPNALARAIFAIEFGDDSRWLAYRDAFYADITSRLPRDIGGIEWQLTSAEIHTWLTLTLLAAQINSQR